MIQTTESIRELYTEEWGIIRYVQPLHKLWHQWNVKPGWINSLWWASSNLEYCDAWWCTQLQHWIALWKRWDKSSDCCWWWFMNRLLLLMSWCWSSPASPHTGQGKVLHRCCGSGNEIGVGGCTGADEFNPGEWLVPSWCRFRGKSCCFGLMSCS